MAQKKHNRVKKKFDKWNMWVYNKDIKRAQPINGYPPKRYEMTATLREARSFLFADLENQVRQSYQD